MKVLLFAGAGTSIELGVPGMARMGEEFLNHTRQWDMEPSLVAELMGDSLDVEDLIESVDQVSDSRNSLETIGLATDKLDRVETIRAEVEWFVQHAAERVVASDARLMWGPLLRVVSSHTVTAVTTNYDRAIEVAANAEDVPVFDGFGSFEDGETASWEGFSQDQDADCISLVKLHGSTDWYAAGTPATAIKLRHPMPLFGRAVLRLNDGQQLGSALVLPSREKRRSRQPYPRLTQKFLNAADQCDVAIFVGSSMRDEHVRDAARSTAKRVPVFVVNPDGDTYGIESVQPIKHTASRFLISSLPNALLTSSPTRALEEIAKQSTDSSGLLDATREALDSDLETERRCHGLDRLDEMGAPLDPYLLRQLLDDEDPHVARYALGLISLSPRRDTLMDQAATARSADDEAFSADLDLLEKLLSDYQKRESHGDGIFPLPGAGAEENGKS